MPEVVEAVEEILPTILKLIGDRLPDPTDQELARAMLADRLKLHVSMQAELDARRARLGK
jgi:hypothetical protein